MVNSRRLVRGRFFEFLELDGDAAGGGGGGFGGGLKETSSVLVVGGRDRVMASR